MRKRKEGGKRKEGRKRKEGEGREEERERKREEGRRKERANYTRRILRFDKLQIKSWSRGTLPHSFCVLHKL